VLAAQERKKGGNGKRAAKNILLKIDMKICTTKLRILFHSGRLENPIFLF